MMKYLQLEEKTENIKKILKWGKLTIKEIAEDFEINIEFVSRVQQQMNL